MRSARILTGLLTLAAAALTGCSSTEAEPPVTYTMDAQPIFAGKCSPCHAGENQGHHDIASKYADAHKLVDSVQFDACWGDVTTLSNPKTVGECALILSRSGLMPFGFQCDKTPQPIPAACVTTAEQKVLADWVAAGMPQ